jgi:hypothetical protein
LGSLAIGRLIADGGALSAVDGIGALLFNLRVFGASVAAMLHRRRQVRSLPAG